MTKRKWCLSVVVLLILFFAIFFCSIMRLRDQFSIDLIADFRLELNEKGQSEAIHLLYLNEIASDRNLTTQVKIHAKFICAFLVARHIFTINCMLNENQDYRISETQHMGNDILEDPEFMRSEFLLRTGGLAKSGERIHFNFLREQLAELGAPTDNLNLDSLKSWFEERYGMSVDYCYEKGPEHTGCDRDCSEKYRVYTEKLGPARTRALRKRYLPLRKSLLDRE